MDERLLTIGTLVLANSFSSDRCIGIVVDVKGAFSDNQRVLKVRILHGPKKEAYININTCYCKFLNHDLSEAFVQEELARIKKEFDGIREFFPNETQVCHC